MSRISAYVRVSSAGQDLKTQKSAILRAAAARGDRIAEWYEDKQSGKSLDRPELDRLRRDARGGALRKVYVFKIDRLSRSGIRDTLKVVDELRAHGCEIATVADGFSLEGPGSELVLAVVAWAAQMERAAIGERIAAARVRVEASGGTWGRQRRLDPGQVTRVRVLALTHSVRSIAAALKIPRATLHDAIVGNGHYAVRKTSPKKGLVKTTAKR